MAISPMCIVSFPPKSPATNRRIVVLYPTIVARSVAIPIASVEKFPKLSVIVFITKLILSTFDSTATTASSKGCFVKASITRPTTTSAATGTDSMANSITIKIFREVFIDFCFAQM